VEIAWVLPHSFTAANKVYHFQLVVGLDANVLPAAAWNDLAVSLDRHTIPLDPEPVQQSR
jgi:hypothetical protein